MAESSRGRRRRAEVDARHLKIRQMLVDGHSVAKVCKEVDITPKRVYVIAERWDLPTNPKIWPGSDDECSVARLSVAGWSSEKIGKIFNQSAAAVDAILQRIRSDPVLKATAKRFGVDAKSTNPGRQSRASSSPNARRRRRS